MKITTQKLPKSEVKLVIELDDEELEKFREKAATSLNERVSIPGFRSGKAPVFAVESAVSKDVFFKEVLRFALPLSYAEAVKKENLAVISKPKITVILHYPLKYEAVSALMPEIKIKDYKKIKPPNKQFEVSEEEVDEVIEEMRKYHAVYNDKSDSILKGDRIEIDFQGFDEKGDSLEKTASKNHPLFVGEGTLVQGFEEQLIGMKKDEKKTFELVFPQNFHYKLLAGKKVKFEVEVKRAQSVILPQLDENFVEKIFGKKEAVSEFRVRIKEDLKRRKIQQNRIDQENYLVSQWLKLTEIEVPPTLTDEEKEYLTEQVYSDMRSRGIPLDKYDEYVKKQNLNLEKEAQDRLKTRLMLQELFKTEEIEVKDEEIEDEINRVAAVSPKEEEKRIRDMYTTDRNRRLMLTNSLKLKKLFDRFIVV